MKKMLITALVALLLLSACSGQGTSDSAGDARLAYESSAGMDAASAPDQFFDTDGGGPETGDIGSGEYLVREASLGLKVDDIMAAAAQVRQIADVAGGSVTHESFGDGYYGPASTIDRYGSITISVPGDTVDETMTRLSEIGEVRTRSSNAYSVEDEYVDVEARIATLRASIDRMRDLMELTEDIDQIVKLETALSGRQADLDSLQARLNSLDSRIAMSPINVQLTTTDDLGEPSDGFLGALKDAWSAFTTSAGILITTIGALVPWIIAGGLGVWLMVRLVRWLQNRSARPAAAQPAAPVTQPEQHEPTQPTEPEQAPPAER